MWKGRFQEEPSVRLQRFGESVSFDWRLFRQDIRGSIAHARALAQAGILTDEEFHKIKDGLEQIGREIEAGSFVFKQELEDVHMNIEAELTRRIGSAGAKLHTARSRNDQVATDIRLYLRDACTEILCEIRTLQRALVLLGERSIDLLLPGYTHLQRAQPVPVSHHLLAYVEMLDRDYGRIADALRRMNKCPLGSGAIAGSTIVLDRESVAAELGFDAPTTNSMDAVADRDFACEILSAIAIAGMHLSRLGEDVILWCSAEFGFLRLADAHTTGSSLMPQKKNPDIAELTRGKTGRLYGNLFSLLTTLKGLPLTYNRDMQEDKEPLFDSIDTVCDCLGIFAEMMNEARFVGEAMARAVQDPLLLATDVADLLVVRGVPFRQAHEMVGHLVAEAEKQGCSLAELSGETVARLAPLAVDGYAGIFDLRRAMSARKATGAPSPDQVRAQIERWKKILSSEHSPE
jgi:argininosuccinate lyase